jgi:catalase (peroxidase I)
MSDRQEDFGEEAVVTTVDLGALKADIRAAIVNQKANACPMIIRLAWHASGTFCQADSTGGSNGATMRFAPESGDDANAGLNISRAMLVPVCKAHPEVSIADIWCLAGCVAIEIMGGPAIPFKFGRSDAASGASCPVVGRLPDANLGAQHLRDVFYRMGFSDQDIVALSGAHTLGRCHESRSGFDGPWTRTPLKFNNSYFSLLLGLDWKPRKWNGPLQYEAKSGDWDLMMLPTDMAIKQDAKFRVYAEKYASDSKAFFKDFATAFGKLIALGCPEKCQPGYRMPMVKEDAKAQASARFREFAMHGSTKHAKELFATGTVDPHAVESSSGRTALHKAAFWDHKAMCTFLLADAKINPNAKDGKGDTALHDAARFGHVEIVKILLKGGADATIANKAGQTPVDIARLQDMTEVLQVLQTRSRL